MVFTSSLPSDIPLRKPNSKPVKDSKDAKYGTFTPLLSEVVSFSREILGKISQLKFIDYDFNDHKKYPQFALDQYLQQIRYRESEVMILEPQRWANGLVQSRLLNMLNVLHFDRSSTNTTRVHQLLVLIHD